MSALTAVRLIIDKMTAEEKKVARNFLTAFSARGTKAPNQALKLFEHILEETQGKPVLRDEAIEKFIYNGKGGSAFPRLILRLRDKLFESLLLSVNLERDGAYSERGRVLHEIRKNISQAQILQSRGTWTLAMGILDDCIRLAEKFEHYEELVAAVRVRLEMRSIDKGKITLDQENAKYNKAIRCLSASKKALIYFHELTAQTEFKAAGISMTKVKEYIDDLQLEYEATGSANVAFFSNYLEIHLFQELGMYKSASIILKRQADLVEVHPAVYSKTRLAGVYINLAWNELYPRNFESALNYSNKAKELLSDNHFNLFRCYDTDFYAYFYTGQYELALDRINLLLKSDNSAGAEYRTGKREYLRACTLFMLGQHEQVQKILTNLNPIEDDHEGWNLAMRMLFIMNDIEQEKTENAFNRIENLRKHIDKLRKNNKDIPRELVIFDVLRTLVNAKFDFGEIRKRKATELEKLTQVKDEYRWKILSPEMVIFDQWFESKVSRKKFGMVIPEYGSPILNTRKLTEEMAAEADFPKAKLLLK